MQVYETRLQAIMLLKLVGMAFVAVKWKLLKGNLGAILKQKTDGLLSAYSLFNLMFPPVHFFWHLQYAVFFSPN